jgi:hypothetical protein
VFSEVQPQDLPASHAASVTSGNEGLVGPVWGGDSDEWQRIGHLLPGKAKGPVGVVTRMNGRELATCFPVRNFLTVQAISVSTGNFSSTVKRCSEAFIIYLYQVLKVKIQVYFMA